MNHPQRLPFWVFTNAWSNTFVNGVSDHAIKALCRLYVSQAGALGGLAPAGTTQKAA